MQPLEWYTITRRVNELIPVDFNPRTITPEKREKLQRSLEKFNLVEIPVINRDNTLIAGHQRISILFILGRGEEEIEVRWPNRQLTEEELKEYMIISNTHAGEFDFDLLDEFFADIDFDAIGFDIPDFTAYDIPDARFDAQEDGYIIPEEIITDIVVGDYFEIGPHRLLCGDATLPETWQKLCNPDGFTPEQFDIIVTDPPYNVDYTGATAAKMKIMNDKMSASQFYAFLFDFYNSIGSAVKPGGVWYIFHADTEGHNFRNAFIQAGNKLAGCLVWVKNSIVMGRSDYQWQHEPVLYGWKLGAGHQWYSDRKQSTVLNFDRPTRNEKHPTMKPIPLVAYLLQNSARPGDCVGDGFLGSGTTMVTAHRLQMHCYGSELDPKFCQVILERMLMLDPGLVVKRNGVEWYPEGHETIKTDQAHPDLVSS